MLLRSSTLADDPERSVADLESGHSESRKQTQFGPYGNAFQGPPPRGIPKRLLDINPEAHS
jgi:hypothetical protein